MTEPSPSDPPPASGRSRLIGRVIVVGFGLLLLVYIVPLALSFLTGRS